jgi:hypothetical protein
MKTTKYLIFFFALLTGFLFSCKKETETRQLTAPYETSATDTDTIGMSDMDVDSISVAGSGMSASGNSGETGKKDSALHSTTGASKKSSKNNGVDMTKDTIMTPADKLGPSDTPGSGKGNTRNPKK